MEQLTTLYLRYGNASGTRIFVLAVTLALALAGTLGVFRPQPDCNSGCLLI